MGRLLLVVFILSCLFETVALGQGTGKYNLPEGSICNFSICQKDLNCMVAPVQERAADLLSGGEVCSKSSECASEFCKEDTITNTKKCAYVMKCFRPVSLGERCDINPNCQTGKCEPFNLNTNGVGECAKNTEVCGSNSDCCSNLCQNKICVAKSICKKCAKRGEVSSAGNCCEGLVLNDKGVCTPDLPQYIVPEI